METEENEKMATHSEETRAEHREYWRRLNKLHKDTVDHFLELGKDKSPDAYQGARQVCEFFAAHKIDQAIEQAKFLANYAEDEKLYGHFVEMMGNYRETLPEVPYQIGMIVYNLCGERELKMILESGEIPPPCSNAITMLSNRRKGFLIEHIEMTLVIIVKGMAENQQGKQE